MVSRSLAAIIFFLLTLQKSAIFSFSLLGMGTSERQTNISGLIPIDLNSFTECCVGLVFSSPDDERNGKSVK